MEAVYVLEGTKREAGPDEVIVYTRDVTHLQHAAAKKATDIVGSPFGQHSLVLGRDVNPS